MNVNNCDCVIVDDCVFLVIDGIYNNMNNRNMNWNVMNNGYDN